MLREQLEFRILQAIVWIETRDMGADGLTKGTVPRDLIRAHMKGEVCLLHPSETWIVKDSASNAASSSDQHVGIDFAPFVRIRSSCGHAVLVEVSKCRPTPSTSPPRLKPSGLSAIRAAVSRSAQRHRESTPPKSWDHKSSWQRHSHQGRDES